MSEPIDIQAERTSPPEPPQTQALAIRETGGAVGKALSLDQIAERLLFVRTVMRDVMKEGQDYGKIPGTGDKPSLLQPGAQKLLMTFNLREQIKKETLREYPDWHREYEIIVTVFPSGQDPANGWDGVGTCSTLESKYRYRKAERRCPRCGKNSIIQSKAEYGGGFSCWKKKGGCDAKFAENDPAITSQPGGETENEDPADVWNTVRKMAFKRALVAAAINATNTSELWTQDLEDMAGNADAKRAKNAPGRAGGASAPSSAPPAANRPPAPAQRTAPPQGRAPETRIPTEATRQWAIKELLEYAGPEGADHMTEYLRKADILLPTETIQDLPLRWCPASRQELNKLKGCFDAFVDGAEAEKPYGAHGAADTAPAKPKAAKPAPAVAPKATETRQEDPEWWREVIVPIPRKGQRRDDYLEEPDTIGSLYDACHDSTADAQESRQRLWGFAHHFEPKGWTKQNGDQMPPSEADKAFRVALDAFLDWHEKNRPGEKL